MKSFQEDFSKINTNFEKLLKQINHSSKDIYEKCLIVNNKKLTDLDIYQLSHVLEYLNIDIRELSLGNICSKTVSAQMNGDHNYIKAACIGNEGTRLRSVDSALSLLEPSRRAQLLRKYQLKEEIFKDKTKLVSVEVMKSLFDDVAKYSYSQDVGVVGQGTCRSFLDSSLGDEVKSFTSPAETYVYFVENCAELIEKNMDYKVVQVHPRRIVIEYKTKEKLQDFFKVKTFGNSNFCNNIKGFLEELIKFRYRYPATVNKLSCAHYGSGPCSYEIIFDNILIH